MELGGDSLSAVQIGRKTMECGGYLILFSIAQGLSDIFRVDVSVNLLFGQSATVDDVARMIDQSQKLGKGGAVLMDAKLAPQGKSEINFKQESSLDEALSFPPPNKELHETPLLKYRNVFLTGCTGRDHLVLSIQ